MKAAWFETVGAASEVIEVGQRDTPSPAAGEVLVAIKASGVNPSDVKTRAGARGPIAYPYLIPHSDGAGVIEAVGEGVDSNRVGQRVWIWNGAWKRQFGTCAEYISVPEKMAVKLPDNTGFDAGACLGIPASTACYGLFADGEIEGQTVLVTGGAGAVGHYAIQLAKWAGARVITTVSNEDKAARAKASGADHVINYKSGNTTEAILDAAGGRNVDRVVEVEFGGNMDVTNQVLRPGGTIATYGSMANPTPSIPFYDMMFNGTTLRMFLVYLLQGQERTMVCDRVNAALEGGALTHEIAQSFSLSDTVSAHEAVESGTIIGNIVVTT
ncbi:MAG: NADPH:quinone reductase [Pseudomonadota bacterium]